MARRADEYGARGRQTRKRILDGAFRLIGHEKGLGVRIEDLCAAAPISRAAFYHYFSGLEELFAALSIELSHDFNQAVLAAVSRMRTAVERADAGIRFYMEKAASDPAWGWAMVHVSANGPLFGAETAAAALATVTEGVVSGEFDVADPAFGRDLLQGTVLAAMVTQLQEQGGAGHATMVSQHILRGLGVARQRSLEVASRPLADPDRYRSAD